MLKRIAAVLVVAATAGLTGPARGADDFYQARMQEGRLAYQTGSVAEAADLLRIACFGLMDQPLLLSEGLVRLTLAQSKLGRTADVDATLRRFLEVEKRFGTYGRAALGEETKKEFGQVVAQRLPPEALRGVPSLAGLVETEEQKLAKLPPKDRRKAYEAKAKAEPANAKWPVLVARLALEQGDAKDAVRQAGRALELDPANVEALQLRARALTARRDYPEALADLAALPPGTVEKDPALKADLFVALAGEKRWDEARVAAQGLPEEQLARPDVTTALGRLPREKVVEPAAAGTVVLPAAAAGTAAGAATAADDGAVAPASAVAVTAPPRVPSLEETRATVRGFLEDGKPNAARDAAAEAVAAKPDDRELRRLLLEAACMAKDWKRVAAEAGVLAPFRAGEEPSMFYAAVGFYETGRKDEARPLMERARPSIGATPFVNYYAERILK